VGRVGRILYQHEATRFPHGLGADRPVAAGAGEYHREAVAAAYRERPEEQIDRRAPAAWLIERRRAHGLVADLELAIRRDDVHLIGYERCLLVISYLDDGHRRASAEDRGQLALVIRCEMDHDHIGHTEIDGKRSEKLLQRLDAAGRRPDATDRNG